MSLIETPEENWAKAQEAAQVWARKAPEGPLGTIAKEHEPYDMAWLDLHQFHPWGYNVRELYEMWEEPTEPTTQENAMSNIPNDPQPQPEPTPVEPDPNAPQPEEAPEVNIEVNTDG